MSRYLVAYWQARIGVRKIEIDTHSIEQTPSGPVAMARVFNKTKGRYNKHKARVGLANCFESEEFARTMRAAGSYSLMSRFDTRPEQVA